MATPGLTRTYRADTDIPAYVLCSAGSVDGACKIATGPTDRIIGPSEDVPVAATRDCDVVLEGTANIVAGGVIAAEDFVTANTDGSGSCITASPASGATMNYVGKAKFSANAGDIVEVRLGFGQLKG